MCNTWIYVSLGLSLVALLFAFLVARGIKKNPQGTDRMKEISKDIFDGAMAFLNQEYQSLLKFILIVTFVLLALSVLTPMVWQTAASFVIGAALSALAGNVGMRIATTSNSRAAHAVTKDSNKGLRIAFSSGAVMGLCVVGLGLIGVSGLYRLSLEDPKTPAASASFVKVPRAAPGRDVTAVAPAGGGRLWIASRRGLTLR